MEDQFGEKADLDSSRELVIEELEASGTALMSEAVKAKIFQDRKASDRYKKLVQCQSVETVSLTKSRRRRIIRLTLRTACNPLSTQAKASSKLQGPCLLPYKMELTR